MDKEIQRKIEDLSLITREKDGGKAYAEAQFMIGQIYDEQGNSDKAIEHWNKISRDDDKEMFAKAQFNIGVNYYQQGDTQKALEAWQSISREDDAETFARSQLNIGLYYHEKGDIQNALKFWKSISRKDNAEQFGRAQFMIGLEYYKQGDAEEALETWQTISREDDTKTFAQAQFHIGLNYDDQGDSKKAIETWQNIAREDDAETFAKSQLNIGLYYHEKGDIQNALKFWKSISRKDNAEQFGRAQFMIGLEYYKQGDAEEALETWQTISREDSSKQFAQAQLNIGMYYRRKGEIPEAIEAWQSIHRKDDAKVFAQAIFYIGMTYDDQGKGNKAIHAWNQINRNDDKEVFARAQFNIGSNYHREGENEKAIQTWNKITRDDDKEKFAKAQFNIGTKYTEEGNTDKAIEHWNKITRNDDKEVFARAQLNIASQYANKKNFELAISIVEQIDINDNYHLLENINSFKLHLYFELRKYKKALDIAKNIDINSENGYLALIYSRMIELNNSNNTNIEKYDTFFDVVSDIRKELFMNFDEQQVINNHERKLAHYTGLNVTNDLLKINPTSLRLNTINNVNDPTEGRLLIDIVNKDFERHFDTERDYHAFISCFTLNHDHLNQFRLYGKSAGKEATGISLVFCSDFFSRKLSFENISYFKTITNSVSKKDLESNLQTLNTHEETNIESKDIVSTDFASLNSHCGYTNEKDIAIEIPKLSKRPVFRCVYVDAESGFISIAQRDEMTFYRECTFDKNEESHETRIERANDAWVNYQNEISEKENKIKSLIKDLKDAYDDIQRLKPNKNQQELIEDILLPIRYLFKHSAFHEEQECRMIHITTLHDELVQTDFDKKFMYINYSEDVKSNIKQVYIGSESSSYQPFIMKLLGQDKAKHVHISHSPFRNK